MGNRGIDAPESSMPFGKEAKEELVKLVQGKCLKVYVYGEDRYGRCVGDVYFNSVYIQVRFKLIAALLSIAWHGMASQLSFRYLLIFFSGTDA